MDFILMSR